MFKQALVFLALLIFSAFTSGGTVSLVQRNALTSDSHVIAINEQVSSSSRILRQRILMHAPVPKVIALIIAEYAESPNPRIPSNLAAIGGNYIWFYNPLSRNLIRCYYQDEVLQRYIKTSLDTRPKEIYCNQGGNRVSVIEERSYFLPGAGEEIRRFLQVRTPLDMQGSVRVYQCKSRGIYLPIFIIIVLIAYILVLIYPMNPAKDPLLFAVGLMPSVIPMLLIRIFQDEPLHNERLLYSEIGDVVEPEITVDYKSCLNHENPKVMNRLPWFLWLRSVLGKYENQYRKFEFFGLCTFLVKNRRITWTFNRNQKVIISNNGKKVYIVERIQDDPYNFELINWDEL